jgi:excisionase family DNA binding protein
MEIRRKYMQTPIYIRNTKGSIKMKLLTVEEICERLNLGRTNAYKLAKNMKYVKIGRRILVPENEVEAYVEREMSNGLLNV